MTEPPMPSVRLFALDGGLRRHPRVAQWFAQPPAELRGLALRWFEEMRSCGPDVMELLHDEFGLRTQERDIARTELYAAQEAFFCGSGGEIQPILSIDRLPVGKGEVGPVTRQLQEAYFAAVRGAAPGRARWLTPVWAGG